MKAPTWIAGGGVICGMGNSLATCLDAFEMMQPGIGAMNYLSSAHKSLFPVGEVKWSNEDLAARTGWPTSSSRTAMLSYIAAKEAWESAGLGDPKSYKTGFISANTVGGMDKTEDFFKTFLNNHAAGRLREVVQHECGAVTELVADALGIHEHISTISTACSSAANAIMYAARLIENGFLDVAIAGGTDALARFTVNGFNTLMILDQELCRPFDDTRKGLNLGEGAGYVVLVSDAIARKLSLQPWCRLSGFANANDAYHQTASSPDGTGNFLAMKAALLRASLQPGDIAYINLHGTGTANNDASEGLAIERLFGEHVPPASSTKSFTGHTLGASGGIEAVFSSIAVKEGILYPNARFQHRMHEISFQPVTTFSRNNTIKHVLSNSFGFGGNCSSLVFSEV
ncbi:beta-ACP synthase [Chitinophaga caeni]|uniref:Beta-ACP synthase n=1 Tax=Chitinophaga caeni TaxID=2029983 RepID=A0A291QUF6_9BACT|nr:beta-ketoacyl-[acyl-carrier-protein] synthase family protein [Chitinophaga caeni]ATL47598.1 beta-ACP synthase [Chitinophaga caeni]